MSDDLAVIPLPHETGGVTYAVALLGEVGGEAFAEAIHAGQARRSHRRAGYRCRDMRSPGSAPATWSGQTSTSTKA